MIKIQVTEKRTQDAPCKECFNRHLGCHGNCTEYKKYRAQIDAVNKKKQAYINKDIEIKLYKKELHEKRRKHVKRRSE